MNEAERIAILGAPVEAGAGRRGVDGHRMRAQVESVALGRRKPEHAYEHRGHPLRMGNPVALDRGQRTQGIEPRHHDNRPAQAQNRRREPQRRTVVEGSGGQVDGGGVESERP